MDIDIDCRVKDSEECGGHGPVFSCEAKSGSDQILMKGSSVPAAKISSWQRKDSVKSASLRIYWS